MNEKNKKEGFDLLLKKADEIRKIYREYFGEVNYLSVSINDDDDCYTHITNSADEGENYFDIRVSVNKDGTENYKTVTTNL